MTGTLNFCDDPTHVRLYDIREIANVLINSGFKIVKGGTRRNFLGIILIPLIAIYQLLKFNKIMGGTFWDLLGFAEYIYAIKIKEK